MPETMQDVAMLSDESVTIEGEEYDLKRGQVVALRFKTARKYVNQFGIAQYHGDKYPVLEDDYQEEVGPTGEEVEYEEESEESSDDDGGEPVSEEYQWLGDRTVDEVREDVAEIDDLEQLEALLEEAERKGAQEAIEEEIADFEDEEESEGESQDEDESNDSEEE